MENKILNFVNSHIPNFLYVPVKRIYWGILRSYFRIKYIQKGRKVEFGLHFRYSRKMPYYTTIGNNSITDAYNVWNAKNGNIEVGHNCYFGLRNIIMGPISIGDNVSTGPNVIIVGPRHAVHGYDESSNDKTVIGNNAWISAGSIIHFGVQIGENAIISPGSVVTRDVAKDSIIAGNPARDITRVVKFQK